MKTLFECTTAEEARDLIAAGADVNEKGKVSGPLSCAVCWGRTDVVKVLIDNGADVNAKDDSGDTPLHWAAFTGARKITRMLIAAGADVNAKDSEGWTPLHMAALHGQGRIVRMLLAAGADPNISDNRKRIAADLCDKRIEHIFSELETANN